MTKERLLSDIANYTMLGWLLERFTDKLLENHARGHGAEHNQTQSYLAERHGDQMLNIFLMKVLVVLGIVTLLAIWIKYMRLSRMRKSDPEMPMPFRPLALVTIVFDRIFIIILVGFAFLFLVQGHPDMFLPFSCPLDFPLQLMGAVLSGAGMFLSWWAIASFGEFNEPRCAHLKQGHRIIKAGIYRYIRHLQYASKMIIYLGSFLFFSDFLFLLILLSSALLFYFQAKSEEKLLVQVFSEEYKDYQAASGMFFPLMHSL